MKSSLRRPLLLASALLLAVGAIFLWIQDTFYGYVDSNGVLRDSLFLPLGMLSIILGLIGFFFIAIRAIVRTAQNS